MKKTLLIFSLFFFSFHVFSQFKGPTELCKGQKGVLYELVTTSGVDIGPYAWTPPQGATITKALRYIKLNSIGIEVERGIYAIIDYSNSAVSGNIIVNYFDNAGGRTATLAVNINNSAPSPAGGVTGESTVFAGQTNVSYSVPLNADTTSYEWTLPSGATGTSTTNSISVNYGLTSVSGYLTVKGVNSCGVGVLATLVITVNPFGTIITKTPSISYNSPQTYFVGTPISPLIPSNIGGSVPTTVYGQVNTLAGSGIVGAIDGAGSTASFHAPSGMAVDATGSVYVADYYNNKIRKISLTGAVTTFAGSGSAGSIDGTGTAASFSGPYGVAVDATGIVYVADAGNHKIRKITPSGEVTTLAGSGIRGGTDGTGTAASFNNPSCIAVDMAGSVYVADFGNNKIRKIAPTGVVTTLAGSGTSGATDGIGTLASFKEPRGLAVDLVGNIYVADYGNNKIRKITSTGVVSTLAGNGIAGSTDGTGSTASFNAPNGVAVDSAGIVYVTDYVNNKIRKITPTGVVATLAGSGTVGVFDGVGIEASFKYPTCVAVDHSGNIYVTDLNSQKIRKVCITGYEINPTTLPEGLNFDATTGIISGTPASAKTETIYTVTAYNIGGSTSAILSITCLLSPPSISYISPQNYAIGTPISPLSPTNIGGAIPINLSKIVTSLTMNIPLFGGVATDIAGNLYISEFAKITKISPVGIVTTFAEGDNVGSNFGLTVDIAENVYVGDYRNYNILKIFPSGVVTNLAGGGTLGASDGTGSLASFTRPYGIEVDTAGNVYVADRNNYKIRKINPSGVVTTLAGIGTAGDKDGMGTTASFNLPTGVAVDLIGNTYVADMNNHKIKKISPEGFVTTIAGNGIAGATDGPGTTASFNFPMDLAMDFTGNIYVTDYGNNKIRKITSGGIVSTIAGSGFVGAADGIGTEASFKNPLAITIDAADNIYVTDSGNNKIRKIISTGYHISPALPAGLSFDATTGIISGIPTVATVATIYTIIAYNAGGSSSATIVISTSTLGLNEFSKESIKLFPNPTHSVINLSVNNRISLDKVTVVDSTGKVVVEQTQNLSSVNIEKLPNGVYILTAYSEDKKYQEKFIKE